MINYKTMKTSILRWIYLRSRRHVAAHFAASYIAVCCWLIASIILDTPQAHDWGILILILLAPIFVPAFVIMQMYWYLAFNIPLSVLAIVAVPYFGSLGLIEVLIARRRKGEVATHL